MHMNSKMLELEQMFQHFHHKGYIPSKQALLAIRLNPTKHHYHQSSSNLTINQKLYTIHETDIIPTDP